MLEIVLVYWEILDILFLFSVWLCALLFRYNVCYVLLPSILDRDPLKLLFLMLPLGFLLFILLMVLLIPTNCFIRSTSWLLRETFNY